MTVDPELTVINPHTSGELVARSLDLVIVIKLDTLTVRGPEDTMLKSVDSVSHVGEPHLPVKHDKRHIVEVLTVSLGNQTKGLGGVDVRIVARLGPARGSVIVLSLGLEGDAATAVSTSLDRVLGLLIMNGASNESHIVTRNLEDIVVIELEAGGDLSTLGGGLDLVIVIELKTRTVLGHN
jgi:hypothetical protein